MKEMIRGLLEDWIRISSVNPGEQPLESSPLFGEKQYTDRIKQMAEDAGYFCQYQKVTDGRYNLFIYAGNHEKGNPLLLLQTHSDVVAGKPELFRPKTEEGKIYGRGSCDAKGQLCAMLLGLKLARDELPRLPYGVCIALCCDEEFRHTGVDALEKWERKEDVIAAFVGEPTEMKLAAACKGSIRFCIRTVGKQAHTSMTENGVNAIYLMGKVVNIISGRLAAAIGERKDPRCGNASITVSLIKGGTVVNVVPDSCEIHVDRRLIPGEEWQTAYEEIQECIRAGLSPEERNRTIFGEPYLRDPSYTAALSPDIERSVRSILRKNRLCEKIGGLPFGCDASKISPWGIPVFVFGPGSILDAHTEHEFVEISAIKKAAEMYRDVILNFGKEASNEET